MLSTTNSNSNHKDDARKDFAAPITGLLSYISQLQAELDKDPTNDRFYNMPTCNVCNIIEDKKTKDLTFSFVFNKFGKLYTFNIQLPLFANLQPRLFKKEAVDYYTEAHIQETSDQSKGFDILKIIYHPVSKLVMGVASVVNLFGLFMPAVVGSIIPTAMLGAGVASKMGGVLLSLIYVTPMLISYYGNNHLKVKLYHVFADIEDDIQHKRYKLANDKLKKLSFIFQILLDPDFLNDIDLRRKHYNLLARAAYSPGEAIKYYRDELKLLGNNNNNSKLLALKGIISYSEYVLKQNLRILFENERFKPWYDAKRNNCINTSIVYMASYVVQISTDVPLYTELGTKVRAQMQDCIRFLRDDVNFAQAIEKFYKIEWDAYSRHAYPDAAIMYYQLEAIITILSKKTHIPRSSDIEYDECLYLGSSKESLVQSIIDKYYPEKSDQYRDIMKHYHDEHKALRTAKEPPRESSVTVLPDIYTPMALVAMQNRRPLQAEIEKNISAPEQVATLAKSYNRA